MIGFMGHKTGGCSKYATVWPPQGPPSRLGRRALPLLPAPRSAPPPKLLVHLWQKTKWKNMFFIKTVFLVIQIEIGEFWRFPG